MANSNGDEKWYFSKERLERTPSRQCGIEADKELSYRQQAANFIQDMGQRLKVSQLCINTAIVYMHRFYVFHSFTQFPWRSIASASIFLAAKVEEQPRKLEHVIRVANHCKNPHNATIEIASERYQAQSQDLIFNENVLLQTLGFDVAIDHPHTHVVKCCQLVRASKDLAQTSYFMASNSLHLTTMCLQYKPTVVACFCIHLVCKWSNWEIPLSNERREWFSYVDTTVTAELLQQLTEEFLAIFERCPSRLKEKIMAIGEYSPFENEKKLSLFPDTKEYHRLDHNDSKPGSAEDPHKHRSSRPHDASSSSQSQVERENREKQEAEHRHASSKPSQIPASAKPPLPHGHHRQLVEAKLKQHSRPPSSSSSGHPSTSRPDLHRGIFREATKDIGLKDNRESDSSNRDLNSLAREISRDLQQVRSGDKDPQKRDYLLKPNVSKTNSLSEKRAEPGRSKPVDPSKVPPKHESQRRHEESKPYLKTENEIKKHFSSSVYDKNSAFLNKSVNSTSRNKMETLFVPDASKSVLKQNTNNPVKQELHNGSGSSSSLTLPLLDDRKIKPEMKEEIKEETLLTHVKKPSLFSPEKSPPKRPNTPSNTADIPTTPTSQLSLVHPFFDSPVGASDKRSRTVSSSSEPELRPVMKKIDQVEGFENLMRDSSIGIKVNHQVPDIITPITDVKLNTEAPLSKDLKPPDLIPPFASSLSQPIVNGIETNPTLISNLLKETAKVPHLPTIASPRKEEVKEHKDKDHHHKERKKKNKEKHKHKDKDRSKEDKEKKKKHKDKDREKHKNKEKIAAVPAQPIKITISKDKIQPPEPPVVSKGLKIKIPKDRLKADNIGGEGSHPSGGIKIKISKDKIHFASGDSKKRDREKTSPRDVPPNKISKTNYGHMSESKQNGRNSYTKVALMGDGEASMHKLAESKYINKGAST